MIKTVHQLLQKSKYYVKANQKDLEPCLENRNNSFSKYSRRIVLVENEYLFESGEFQEFGQPYIKDCFTYMILFDNYEDLKMLISLKSIHFLHQPYLFALVQLADNFHELYEVQLYSRQIVLISQWDSKENSIRLFNKDIFDRRNDFNGAKIRLSLVHEKPQFWFGPNGELLGKLGVLLNMFRNRFNFTIDWQDFHGYGIQNINGSWTGTIKDVIDNKLDYCKF